MLGRSFDGILPQGSHVILARRSLRGRAPLRAWRAGSRMSPSTSARARSSVWPVWSAAGKTELCKTLFGAYKKSSRHHHAGRQGAQDQEPLRRGQEPVCLWCPRSGARRAFWSMRPSPSTCPPPASSKYCHAGFVHDRKTAKVNAEAVCEEPGHQDALRPPEGGEPVRRQPAEGRRGQVAGRRLPTSTSSTSPPRAWTWAPSRRSST